MSTIARIESLAAGGAGVAHVDGVGAVFVTGAAPGDVLELTIEARSKPARASIVRVVEASPSRVEPPCPHARACGGCDWMHVAEVARVDAHVAIVEAALRRAGIADVPRPTPHLVGASLGYRTRARFFVRAKRGATRVGYRADASHDLVAIDACAVLDPSLEGVPGLLARALGGAHGEGDASVARGLDRKPVVDVTWKGDVPGAVFAAFDALVRDGLLAGARLGLDGVKTPASFGDPRPRLEGADGAPIVLPPGGFAQPSDVGAAFLAKRVAELVATGGATPNVLELFAGSGALSVMLARVAKSLAAVEIDERAVACARENLAARGLEGKCTAADANAFPIPPRAEVVVLDPPRAGALGAARAIAKSSAKVVVYVACDPATLARDVKELSAAGFVITQLETVELFPQTSHVETIARLERRRGKRPSL